MILARVKHHDHQIVGVHLSKQDGVARLVNVVPKEIPTFSLIDQQTSDHSSHTSLLYRILGSLQVTLHEMFVDHVSVLQARSTRHSFANMQPRVEVSVRLRRAVVRNDLALVQRILRTYPDNVHNADHADKSNTSLHVAAREGFYEIAEFIVSLALELELVDKRSSKGHSYQSRKCVVGLTYNTDDQTPLHFAAARSHARIAELLCKHFPQSIEKHDKDGRTPLHLASQAQATSTKPTNPAFTSNSRNLEDTSTLQVLLSHHADVAAVDKVGSTCLHYATAWGNLKAVRVLVQAGADPLAQNNDGWMPQYYSVTVQAEIYFRNLVAEWEKRQAEEDMRHRQRVEAEKGGVRLVSDEDDMTEGTESDDGRNRADSGSSHFTTASEGGLGISVVQGRTDSWK